MGGGAGREKERQRAEGSDPLKFHLGLTQIGQQCQENLDRTTVTGQPGQDSQNMTAIRGQLGQVIRYRSACTGQPEKGRYIVRYSLKNCVSR
jgi:hypothetical protein